ncbi:unnamed protein product, partial [Rotaria magnacalcarata]
MVPCGTTNCPCCSSIENSSSHRFVNGYTTYLNCPASCTTSNIVFVMTCPCGQYKFIDSTSGSLTDALTCIHIIVRKKRFYQHSAHCSVAVHLFLGHNPAYWCFISRSRREVEQENNFYTGLVLATGSEFAFILPKRTNHEKKVARLLTGVMLQPA